MILYRIQSLFDNRNNVQISICFRVASKIGANLPKLHAIEVPIPKKPKAIHMIREFLEECRSAQSVPSE